MTFSTRRGTTRILMIGDSITRGILGAPGVLVGGYRAVLGSHLFVDDAAFCALDPVGGVITANTGTLKRTCCWAQSGKTVQAFLTGGTDDVGPQMLPTDARKRPDVATVMLGTNNTNSQAATDDAINIHYPALLTKFALQRPDMPLLVLTIPPKVGLTGPLAAQLNAAILSPSGFVATAAAAGQLVFARDPCSRVLLSEIGTGSHPTDAGYTKIGDDLVPFVRELCGY